MMRCFADRLPALVRALFCAAVLTVFAVSPARALADEPASEGASAVQAAPQASAAPTAPAPASVTPAQTAPAEPKEAAAPAVQSSAKAASPKAAAAPAGKAGKNSETKKKPKAQTAPEPARADDDPDKILLPPADGSEALKRAFAERAQALEAGDDDAALEREKEILVLRDTLAFDNLFVFSKAVQAEARSLLPNQPDKARARAMFAAELAPSLAAPRWLAVEAEFQSLRQSKSLPGKTFFGALADALKRSFSDPLDSGLRQLDWMTAIPASILFALIAFVLVSFCRHSRRLLHDLSHLTKGGTHAVPRFLALFSVVALSSFLGFGAFAPLALLGFLLIPYMAASERAVLAVCTLLLGAFPLLNSALASRNAFITPDAQLLYVIDRGGLSDPWLHAQEERLQEKAAASYAVSYVLGRKALRMGSYEEAVPLLKQAARLGQNHPEPWIALGNIALVTGDLQAALENYTRARQHAPDSPEAAFNLSGYYLRRAKAETGEAENKQMLGLSKSMLDEAGSLNPELKKLPLDLRANHFVLTPHLPIEALTLNSRQESLAHHLSDRLTRFVFGGRPADWCAKAVLTLLAIWFLYAVARRLVPVASICFRCGAPTCERCSELRCPSPGLCPECFKAYGSTGRIDAIASTRRDMQIQRAQRFRRFGILFSSVFIPCTGDLWLGRAVRGAIGLTLCILMASLFLIPDGLVPSPFDPVPAHFKQFPALAVAVVLWLTSLIRTVRTLREERRAAASAGRFLR